MHYVEIMLYALLGIFFVTGLVEILRLHLQRKELAVSRELRLAAGNLLAKVTDLDGRAEVEAWGIQIDGRRVGLPELASLVVKENLRLRDTRAAGWVEAVRQAGRVDRLKRALRAACVDRHRLREDLDAAACAHEEAADRAQLSEEFLHTEMLGHDQAVGALFLACSHFCRLEHCPPNCAVCPNMEISCWNCWLDWLRRSADADAAVDGGFEYEDVGLVPALAEKQRRAEDLDAAVCAHERAMAEVHEAWRSAQDAWDEI